MNFFKKHKYEEPAPAKRRPKFSSREVKKRDIRNWNQEQETFLGSDLYTDHARSLKNFFATVTRVIPAASSAVWTWRNLCFTNQTLTFIGGSERSKEEAAEVLTRFSERVYPLKSSKGDGFDKLAASWLMNVFRYGRFSGKIVINDGFNSIDKFEILDAFSVYFKKNTYKAYYAKDLSTAIELNKHTFYYFGLDSDIDNPYGVSMIEGATTLMDVVNKMFRDMSLSSSNAGTPRLHIKVKQPDILDNEDSAAYVTRCNNYFDQTINGLNEMAADDNIYTWADVEIETVGGQNAQGFVWKQNLQTVQEELITAFHLFPWIMGKQFGTTRNWVAAQYDVLIQMVLAIQLELSSFLDWLSNTELLLNGITDVKVKRSFTLPRDIAARESAMAEQTKLANTKTKLELGFIDKKAAAREHGYQYTKET